MNRRVKLILIAVALVCLVLAVTVDAHRRSGGKKTYPDDPLGRSNRGGGGGKGGGTAGKKKAKPFRAGHSHSHSRGGDSDSLHDHQHSHQHQHGGGGGGGDKPITPLDERLKKIKADYEKATRDAIAGYVRDGGELEHPDHSESEGSVSFDFETLNAAYWRTVTSTIGGSLVTSIAPAVILLIIPRGIGQRTLNVMLAFAAGGLLGDVFLHLLPHMLGVGHGHDHSHSHGDDHTHKHHAHHHGDDGNDDHHHHHAPKISAELSMLLLLSGIVTFFLLESFLHGGGHSHSHGGGHSHGDEKKNKGDDDSRQKKKKKKHGKDKDSDDDIPEEDLVLFKNLDKKGSPNEPKFTLQNRKMEGSPSSSATSKQQQPPSHNHAETSFVTQEEHQDKKAWLNLLADASHNFTDGMVIGASFLTSEHVGIRTVIVVLLHEIPHELGDFAVLIDCGWDRKSIFLVQLVTAIGNLLGAVSVVVATTLVKSIEPYVMPFVAGTFIYVALVTVLAELSSNHSVKVSIRQRFLQSIAFAVGVAALKSVSFFEEYFGVHAH